MANFCKSFLIVGAHVAAAFLAVLGVSTLVDIGAVSHAGVGDIAFVTVCFVFFALFGLAIGQTLVRGIFNLSQEGTAVNFLLGALVGTAFAALVSPCAALTVSGIGGALAVGFLGSFFVVAFGLATRQMDSKHILPVRDGR